MLPRSKWDPPFTGAVPQTPPGGDPPDPPGFFGNIDRFKKENSAYFGSKKFRNLPFFRPKIKNSRTPFPPKDCPAKVTPGGSQWRRNCVPPASCVRFEFQKSVNFRDLGCFVCSAFRVRAGRGRQCVPENLGRLRTHNVGSGVAQVHPQPQGRGPSEVGCLARQTWSPGAPIVLRPRERPHQGPGRD